MVQTATESFCERCGTRYAFEAPRPTKRGLGRSLARAVLGPSDEEAFSEAHVHDPFLGTFRFCLECRQYTCPHCWNEEAGFCATCVPFPDAPPIDVVSVSEADATVVEDRPVLGAETWPTSDVAPDGGNGASPDLYGTDVGPLEPVATMLKALDDESDVAERREHTAVEIEPVTVADGAAPTADGVSLADAVATPDVVSPAASVAPADATSPAMAAMPGEGAPIDTPAGEPDLALELAWNHLLLSTPTAATEDPESVEDWSAAFVAAPEATETDSAQGPVEAAVVAAPVDLAPEEAAAVVPDLEASPAANEAVAVDEPPSRAKPRSLLSRFRTIRPAAELVDDLEAVRDTTAAQPEIEMLAEPVVEPEPVVEDVAEPVVEPVAEVEAEPVAEAAVEDVAEVHALAEVETVAEPVAQAEPVAEAEPVVEAVAAPVFEAVAEIDTEPVVEIEAVAEPVVEAVAEPVVETVAEPVAEAEPVVEAVAEPVLETVAPPVIDSRPEPVPAPVRTPEPVPAPIAEPAPAPPAPKPQAPPPPPAPVAPALPGWQLTAPDDVAPRSDGPPAVWRPLGPVYRPPADRPRGLDAPIAPIAPPAAFQLPRPSAAAYPAATPPSPSMLARGQAQTGHASSGIRPCASCELPLSASARFCRRCGSRQG